MSGRGGHQIATRRRETMLGSAPTLSQGYRPNTAWSRHVSLKTARARFAVPHRRQRDCIQFHRAGDARRFTPFWVILVR